MRDLQDQNTNPLGMSTQFWNCSEKKVNLNHALTLQKLAIKTVLLFPLTKPRRSQVCLFSISITELFDFCPEGWSLTPLKHLVQQHLQEIERLQNHLLMW